MLYFLPEVEGIVCITFEWKCTNYFTDTQSYKCTVSEEDLLSAEEYSVPKPQCAPEEFVSLASTIMEEDGLSNPTSVDEAQILYDILKQSIE